MSLAHVTRNHIVRRTSDGRAVVRRARPLMGTLVGVTVRGNDAEALEDLVRAIFSEIQRLESIFSEWSSTSVLFRVNASAGKTPTVVPAELVEVLDVAMQVACATAGAFDPTWAVLAACWRLDAPNFRPPSPKLIGKLLHLVDYRQVAIDRHARAVLVRRPGMRLGLGGIAKAYIAERAADFAVENGIRDVLIDAGGDLVARGRNDRRPWTAGIREPRAAGGLLATVELHDEAIVTSGDYERFVEVGGQRYHHLIDPRTGWPAHRCKSATVIARRGALADALATALFVLGAEGLDIISALGATAALVVGQDGTVQRTTGIAERFSTMR